jgi:hypothetical protein
VFAKLAFIPFTGRASANGHRALVRRANVGIESRPKDCLKSVIFLLADRLELVVVAAGALQREPRKAEPSN